MARKAKMAGDLARAIALAATAHVDQVDLAGEAYILHPLRLVYAARDLGWPEIVQVVAVLHDVVEDTAVTLVEIEARFGPEIAAAVESVTRRKPVDGEKEPEVEFAKRAIENPIGAKVKYLDLRDHLLRGNLAAMDPKTRRYAERRHAGYREMLAIVEPVALGV